ncbi:MAG: hypothetical protein MJH09_06865 [Cetobacterium sp.]|nr:hypothetical protein [Cetobacterium sp.]
MFNKLKENALNFLDNSTNENGVEIISDCAEIFGENIPGISILFNGRKFYLGYQEKKFLSKLTNFIKDISSANLKDFDWNDDDFNNKLITVIDKIDFEEKIDYLSKLFILYSEKRIDKTLFFRCCKILEQSSYYDIFNFKNKNYELGSEDGPLYLSIGLLENKLPKKGQTVSPGSIGSLSFSQAGEVFLKIK